MDTKPRIDISPEKIATFCQRWHISELDLFGSVIRDDFTPESDVDILVTFEEGHIPMKIEDLLDIRDELAEIVGRKVDVVERRLIEASKNPYRKRHILENRLNLYAA